MNGDNDRDTGAATPDGRGDPPLERAWRDASRELPPPHLDARILAAARASLGSVQQPRSTPPARSRWSTLRRWQPVLAAAAVAGLAFVLVPMTLSPPTERAASPTATHTVQAPPSATPAYEFPQRPGASDDVGETRPLLRERTPRAEPAEDAVAAPGRAPLAKREAETTRPAAVPPPPMAAESVLDDAAVSADRSSLEPPTAGASSSVDDLAAAQSRRSTESAAPAAEKQSELATAAGTGAWVERIASAYRRGDLAIAARELRAFRAVEPAADDLLPDDLGDWARTVR
jgi:cytoskeletal protein RodZ